MAASAPDLWSRLQPLLQTHLGAEEYEVWFAPLSAELRGPTSIRILTPSRVYADYIRDHHLPLLRKLASQLHSSTLDITLDVDQEQQQPASSPLAPHPTLNPRYTFATFVPGPSNQFARAAAQSVAENPGGAYNPLFLYGGSGLGKTHLLHAVANQVLANTPSVAIRYVPTEHFVNEFIHSIRRRRMSQFRDTYRSLQLLLLDDVHVLAGKEGTQEEFFHTFNALHESGHQIVLTSDTSPANIKGLEERLRTRFIWGLVADIQPPDLETKCAIIRDKANAEGLDLPSEVVLFIARRVRSNVRELEGYLNRVIIFSTLAGIPPTVDGARAALSAVLPQERTASPADIIRFVAHHYGLKVADLKGKDNRRSVAFPRQVAMYLIRDILDLSYPEIAKLFAKHHSTVMYSVDTITQQRLSNPALDSTLTTFAEHFR